MTRTAIALVAGALLVPTLALRAAPLDKDECAKLKTEQSQLEQAGTRGGMGRGPEWAKANLAPEKLQQIRRLIEVDEQILFRCQGRPLVNLRETDPQLPPAEGKEAAKRPVAKAAKTPDAEKAQKKAPAAVKKAATPPVDAAKAPVAPVAKKAAPVPPPPAPSAKIGKEGEDKKAAAAKAAKAKPKVKVDDAYRPPAPEWGSNPFADQLAPAGKK
jgi:hypothetical protein